MDRDWNTNCEINKLICSSDFPYLQPWFYNHPYALRCELGLGCGRKEYLKNARKRAWEIFNILFSNNVDAIFFDYWINDWFEMDKISKNIIKDSIEKIKIAAKWINNYPHTVVRGLTNGETKEDIQFRSRIVCYIRDKKINYRKLIKYNTTDKIIYSPFTPFSFVSFQNECIMSIYDDRGCDIVFANKEKMCEFYSKLKPYLFDYDMEEMERRVIY